MLMIYQQNWHLSRRYLNIETYTNS
ncbi:hypothetical protein EMIT093MI4_170052 [Pseudomonas sp. IT-93MI4]